MTRSAPDLRHAPQNGGEPVLDPATLEALADLGGDDDPDLLVELVGLFLHDAESRVQSMVVGLDHEDFERVRHAAHALKSASANLGALAFSNACRSVEHAAHKHESSGAEVELVERMYPEVVRALEQLRTSS